MLFSWTPASSLVLGTLLTVSVTAPVAMGQDYVTARTITASRCADFGPDFIDMGNGICGRVGSTSRVQLGTRSDGTSNWAAGRTSHAALQSDNMLQGAGMQHMRVHNDFAAPPYQ